MWTQYWLIQNNFNFFNKREKKDCEEDNLEWVLWIYLMLFMHLLPLKWRLYITGIALKMEIMMKEETLFHHLPKRYQLLIYSTYFITTIALLCLVFFSKCLFLFPSKHIKITLKIFKLILDINVERKVNSHHIVRFYEMERKP